MSIITIFSASYCNENEITEQLSKKLDYEVIDELLIEQTSKRYNVATKKLQATLRGDVSFFNNVTHEREKNTAYLKSTLADIAKKDNIIYHGFATHLLPKNISHILMFLKQYNK